MFSEKEQEIRAQNENPLREHFLTGMLPENQQSLLLNVNIFSAEFDDEEKEGQTQAGTESEDITRTKDAHSPISSGVTSSAPITEEDPDFCMEIDETIVFSHTYQVKKEFNDFLRKRTSDSSAAMRLGITNLSHRMKTGSSAAEQKLVMKSSERAGRQAQSETARAPEEQRKYVKSNAEKPTKASLSNLLPLNMRKLPLTKNKSIGSKTAKRLGSDKNVMADRAPAREYSLRKQNDGFASGLLESLLLERCKTGNRVTNVAIKTDLFDNEKFQDPVKSKMNLSLEGKERSKYGRLQLGSVKNE